MKSPSGYRIGGCWCRGDFRLLRVVDFLHRYRHRGCRRDFHFYDFGHRLLRDDHHHRHGRLWVWERVRRGPLREGGCPARDRRGPGAR
jgi:hypothetical protein